MLKNTKMITVEKKLYHSCVLNVVVFCIFFRSKTLMFYDINHTIINISIRKTKY